MNNARIEELLKIERNALSLRARSRLALTSQRQNVRISHVLIN